MRRQGLGDFGQHVELLHAVGRRARDVVECDPRAHAGHLVLHDWAAGFLIHDHLVEHHDPFTLAVANLDAMLPHGVLGLDHLEQHLAHQPAGESVVVVDFGQRVEALFDQ